MLSRFLSSAIVVVAPALVYTMPATVARESVPAPVTSIGQVKDVSRNDPYYEALRSLIEQYQLNLTYADGTFRGNQALTRADFVVYLHQVLENLEVLPLSNAHSLPAATAQARDIQPTDFYYEALQELVENYGLTFNLIQGEFRPRRAITKGEATRYLYQVFGYPEGSMNNVLSLRRGEFVIELYQALRRLERPSEVTESNVPNSGF
ncbi:S-layer homology domain-containing protein [Desertifilum sp. FACHB-1129]|uniref:SLH domain-containing protein n=2 Tax=Desertifilum tharense IPPAS B-1220 TaxID=1781255 RepID=A0A1E5QJZ0_9CYAN|nr:MULTISPECIES: S-layer homology domain-containing protein [Desertifilum]MDA0210928.1 S-layer homology domain-containing protein [Cyanobacteria bacterium FC1]MBD2313469.1 S-layer homology domain-containing protein [Desertifilum sp. FACHB-1129]MBD2322339.1 S-layer homology domain-containing protein [Desertifilum sp. FACHB-866]MBD2332501.1 S-layer homology domain-containing protein [Desertifilum sp. FACHB-868]OEJ74904.1 hypothetical protein BH720_12440 [Desertifilum tharense IPPAS B-1220]